MNMLYLFTGPAGGLLYIHRNLQTSFESVFGQIKHGSSLTTLDDIYMKVFVFAPGKIDFSNNI